MFCFCIDAGQPAQRRLNIRPSEVLSAQDVVEIQLLGLQAGDGDRQAGIEQVWIFAHPDNKRVTGPLAKFSTLFDIPAYAPLLGHLNYVINDSRIDNGVARFVLTVLARDGSSYGYLWVLRLAELGADDTASGQPETAQTTTAVLHRALAGPADKHIPPYTDWPDWPIVSSVSDRDRVGWLMSSQRAFLRVWSGLSAEHQSAVLLVAVYPFWGCLTILFPLCLTKSALASFTSCDQHWR